MMVQIARNGWGKKASRVLKTYEYEVVMKAYALWGGQILQNFR